MVPPDVTSVLMFTYGGIRRDHDPAGTNHPGVLLLGLEGQGQGKRECSESKTSICQAHDSSGEK